MLKEKYNRNVDLISFLFISIIPIIISYFGLPIVFILHLLISLLIIFYLFENQSRIFYPSLFFLVLYLVSLWPLVRGVWLPNLVISISVYLFILRFLNLLKQETSWLKSGKIRKKIVLGIALTILVSSVSLVLWLKIFKPDLGIFLKVIPDVHVILLLLGTVAFSVLNAFAEEFVFRGLFWNGLERVLNSVVLILLIQAFFFGISHYNGFPNGIAGIGLAFIYGIFLGVLKQRSNGLLAPIIAHIFADITITLILFKTGDII